MCNDRVTSTNGRGHDRAGDGRPDREAFRERQRSWSTCNIIVHRLRFFFHETLKRDRTTFSIPSPRQPGTFPALLSREEVLRLIAHTANHKHRTMLMTTYAAGLRLNEVLHLRVGDIDSARMMIRVEQGKGGKDRYTVLSPGLLAALRAYWPVARPRVWLFPSSRTQRPMDPPPARARTRSRNAPRASPSLGAFTACDTRSRPWKDCADHDRQKVLALAAEEFLRRFLLHVLPRGFMRIRHFGILANRTRHATLDRCRQLLDAPAAPASVAEPLADLVRRLTGLDVTRCAVCGLGRMHRTVLMAPRRWAPTRPPPVDTS